VGPEGVGLINGTEGNGDGVGDRIRASKGKNAGGDPMGRSLSGTTRKESDEKLGNSKGD